MRYLILSICLTIAVLMFITSHVNAAPVCTVMVPISVTTIDGIGNYNHIKPGDTICLAAGSRSPLTIKNIRGQSGKLITIINSGGTVQINANQGRVALEIATSSYIRLTGTGVSELCGYSISAAAQQCGIDLFNATKAISVESPAGDVNNIEIDHITAHDSNPNGAFPTGLSLKPLNQKTMTDIHIHHTYVHNTTFEGMYLGNDPNKPASENGTMANMEVDHNLVEQTGFDGINVKQTTNVQIHHNIVNVSGLMNGKVTHVPEGGIQLASSMGEVFNNLVIDSYDTGINIGRELSNSATKIYNNVIVNSTKEGIKTQESNATIYNNTVITNGGTGIHASGIDANVYDNIVVGTIVGKNSGNNLIGTVDAMKFANPTTRDYHLTTDSPAVNRGGNAGLLFDFDDKPRPNGSASDIGAYEFVSSITTPTVSITPGTGCPRKSEGDSNCDGTIDIVDFEIFRKEFTGILSTKTADFDANNNVDIVDFEIWRRGMFI